jgi:hypothetical protein
MLMDYKFLICVGFDAVDFTLGRIIGFGSLFDICGIFVAYYLCGPIGVAYAWEVLDVTDQIDGFVPTMSILYLVGKVKRL